MKTTSEQIEERYPGMHEHYRGKKVLVTGATGFVGGHVAKRLILAGANVRLLVRQTSSKATVESFKAIGAEIVYGDFSDRLSAFRAVEGIEYVFHIGALYREAKFADEVFFKVNRDGTKYLLDAAVEHKVAKFIFCSTTGVHSHIENPPADEDAPFHPADAYQVSKAEAELLVREYFDSKKLHGAVIRPAMIWGEGDTRFLKLFRGISQRKMPIIGNGKTWTHWIYIADLVDAFLLAGFRPEADGRVYLIAGRRPVPMQEVFETIAKIASTHVLPVKVPIRPLQMLGSLVEKICRPFGIEPPLHRRRVDFFIKNRSFKIDRAKSELGYSPRLDFVEEARRIYDWYISTGWLKREAS